MRLIDFDAARLVKEKGEEDTHLLGTRGYAPPEQFGYGQTEARSDLYSLGITMKEALSPDYRGYLLGILSRCTQVDVQRRCKSARELAWVVCYGRYCRLGKLFAVATLLAALIFGVLSWQAGSEPQLHGEEEIEEEEKGEHQAQWSPDREEAPASKTELPPVTALRASDTKAPLEKADISLQFPVREEEPHPTLQETMSLETVKERIYMAVYWNGQELWRGRNGFDYPINNAGKMINLPKTLWQQWGSTESPVSFPADWQLRVHVQNASSRPWQNPKLELSYEDQGAKAQQVLQGATLQPGEEMDFAIPLGGCQVQKPWQEHSANLHLHLSGEGGQDVFSSDYEVSFLFLQ